MMYFYREVLIAVSVFIALNRRCYKWFSLRKARGTTSIETRRDRDLIGLVVVDIIVVFFRDYVHQMRVYLWVPTFT